MHWPGSVRRTHSYSVTLSERVSLAHTPGAQERAGSRSARKSCAGFYSRLIGLGSAFALRSNPEPAESCPPGSAPGSSGLHVPDYPRAR